jgi:hypothetical protein
MAINFPVAITVGQTYTDPTSGNTYAVIAVGPPAQWIGTGSAVDLDATYFRVDTTNGPMSDTLVVDGNILPQSDNARNLGSPSARFANVYTGDLHLKNDRGDWTMVEEEESLTLRNNKTGKVFALEMTEISD